MKKKFSLTKISKKDAENCKELFTPLYESDIEISRSLKPGQRVAGSVTTSDLRNLGFHKKFYALLKLTFENLPEKLKPLFKNIEELRTELKLQTGYREERVSLSGKRYYVPKSMSFATMGAEDFNIFYKKSVDVICKFILPGVESEELDRQILGFM